MNYKDFDKLKDMYTQLIELVCYAKETDSEDEKIDCFLKMFQIVRACLKFSPFLNCVVTQLQYFFNANR